MKTLWMAALVAAAVGVAGVAAAEMKVATVNANRLLKEYYKTELAESHMQEQAEDFTSERDELLAQHKKLKKDFETLRAESQNTALTDEARDKKKVQAEDKLSEVIAYENSIREKALNRRRQLEGEGRRMQLELVKAIRNAVRSYAEKNGYTLVMDSSGILANGFESVMYAGESLDITAEVLKILNADKPAGTGAAKAPAPKPETGAKEQP